MELVISMCVICAYSEMIELHWSLRGAQVPGMKNEGPKESYDEERDEADSSDDADSSEPLVTPVDAGMTKEPENESYDQDSSSSSSRCPSESEDSD